MNDKNELMDALRSAILENMEKYNIRSIAQLHDATAIPESTLSHIMKGETQDIHLSHVVRLANAFSLTVSEFLDTEAFRNLELHEKKSDD